MEPGGLAFDPRTVRSWKTEHGPRSGDELNVIEKGKNYGWPVIAHGIDYPGTAIGEGIAHKEVMEEPVYIGTLSMRPPASRFTPEPWGVRSNRSLWVLLTGINGD